MATERAVELSYSKESKTIELMVPHGTKMADMSKIIGGLVTGGIIGRLPRGCNTCTSGDHFNVRERAEQVISVDLETLQR